MCGICGTISFEGVPPDEGALRRACEVMRHRGPDDAGTVSHVDDGWSLGLGAVRLAVLDPTPVGHQPMSRADGRFLIAYNGEVYNFTEVRAALTRSGIPFSTGTDTEVVLAACVQWGVDALSRFNGMWALAFFDTRERYGFVARDRFGIKPLMYRVSEGRVSFASELDPLVVLDGRDLDIDREALAQHLQFGYIAAPASIYRQVRRLPPGHVLHISDDGVGMPQRYFLPPILSGQTQHDAGAPSGAELRARIGRAVARRRVSDVPIGAFLSGGLDSSIVVKHLAEVSSQPIRTFAVGYAGQRAYDETSYARVVAERFATHHQELRLTPDDVLRAIPDVLSHLSEPVGDSSIIPTSLVSQFARQSVTVALSGDGGDELFGGYWRYLGHQYVAAYMRLPKRWRQEFIEPWSAMFAVSRASVLGNRARQFRKLLRGCGGDAFDRHVAFSRILAPECTHIFERPDDVSRRDRTMAAIARWATERMPASDPLNRIFVFDLLHQLPFDMLQKVDLASMMHALEVRVPLLDPEVVAWATSMPSSLKIDRGMRKAVLVDAYRGHLPDEVLDRGKRGFEVPIGEFLRGPLRTMFTDTVTRPVVESFGVLSWPHVKQVYADHVARRGDHADLLFALLSLCWWKRRPKVA